MALLLNTLLLVIMKGFENSTNFANEWSVVEQYLAPTLETTNFAAHTGSGSLWINNRSSIYQGSIDQAISPSLKMSDVLNPSISMEIAYRRRNASSNDKINLSASLDCGVSWINIITMQPSFFAFDNANSTGNFIPSSQAQWKTVTIPSQFINASIKTGDNVKFLIEVEYGGGNNVWIDNFRINGQLTGIDDIVEVKSDFLNLS